MDDSMKNKDFSAALQAAQQDITHATQDGTNSYIGSQYATLQSVIDTAKKALNAHGLVFHQVVIPTEANSVCVETFIIGFGAKLSGGPVAVPIVRVDPQGFGASLSYCRRYSLSCAVGIFQKDSDAEEGMLRGKYKILDVDNRVICAFDDKSQVLSECRKLLPNHKTPKLVFAKNALLIAEAQAASKKQEDKDAFAKMVELYGSPVAATTRA